MSTPIERLLVLQDEWHGCTRCKLSERRSTGEAIAFGYGAIPADFFFLGSGPTSEDEQDGLPFTPDSQEGELLRHLLDRAGIDLDRIFWSHALGCAPKERPEVIDEQGTEYIWVKPPKDALLSCFPRVQQQIYEVDPRLIVTFGLDALLALHPTSVTENKRPGKISDAQGHLYEVRIPSVVGENELVYPVFALLDITHLIKNPSSSPNGPIATTLEDLRKAKQFLDWIYEQENSIHDPHESVRSTG